MGRYSKFKRIGVLTSGGDAPGMNAAIRAVVRSASYKGIEVMGIYCGYKGLLENDMKLLTQRDVSNIINHGGTMLYSNRCDKFKTQEGLAIAVENCRRNGIEELTYTGDAQGTLTTHNMFVDTQCPGPYLESRMEDIAAQVNANLQADTGNSC